jgi:ACS family hexuronate transporter-like MFS transporter
VELYPQWQIGKAAGLVAMGSGFGGMLSSEAIGYLVTHGGYTPVFYLMALLHPIAIALLWHVFSEQPQIPREAVPAV